MIHYIALCYVPNIYISTHTYYFKATFSIERLYGTLLLQTGLL